MSKTYTSDTTKSERKAAKVARNVRKSSRGKGWVSL